MSKKKQEQEIEDNELVSYFEEKLGHLKPYWSQITLGICLAILVMLGAVFLWQQNLAAEATKWQLLSIAQGNYSRTLDNRSLIEFADQYPDDQAGLWGLLYAADAEMRAGLNDLSTDRTAGFDKIKKAQKFYQNLVDSSVKKTTMLQRRSTFGLAYACESLGEFDRATELYNEIAGEGQQDDGGDENPFYAEAKRALERTENEDYKKLYEQFRTFEVTEEEAPGMKLPKRPDISFPDPEVQPDSGGGDFGSETEDTESGPSDTEPTEAESAEAEDASDDG